MVGQPSGDLDDSGTAALDESQHWRHITYTPTGLTSSDTDFAVDPANALGSGNPVPVATRTYTYTQNGWIKTAVDPLETGITYSYDLRGNPEQRTSTQTAGEAPDCSTPGSTECIVESWTYNRADQVTSSTRPRDNTTTTTSTITRDSSGRAELTIQPYADGIWRCIETEYSGHRTSMTSYYFNDADDCRGGTTTGSIEVNFTYDALDQRTHMTDDAGETLYVYDAAGRLSMKTDPLGEDLSWGWTIGGSPRGFIHNDGAVMRYTHDDRHRLQSTSVWYLGVLVPLATYDYDHDNIATTEVLGSSPLVLRSWLPDELSGRITTYEQDFSDTADDIQTDLAWREDGRIAAETTNGVCTSYSYDLAGQLIAESEGADCEDVEPVDQFTYEGHGNRITRTRDTVTLTSVVDEADQLTELKIDATSLATYDYDWAGNRTRYDPQGNDSEYVYNWGSHGKIASADLYTDGDPHHLDATLQYDGAGQILELTTVPRGTETSETDNFVWDPTLPHGQIVDAYTTVDDGENATTTHQRQNYGLRRVNALGQKYSYDWLGSTLHTAAYSEHPTGYGPFGEPSGVGDDQTQAWFGYRGELQLGALVYLRNRMYDASTGTFLSRDPMDGVDGTPTVAHAYHYADNDPLNRTDPLGLRPGTSSIGYNQVLLGGSGLFGSDDPPPFYNRRNFTIYGVELRARGWNMQGCVFSGGTCRSMLGNPKNEATAQSHAIRELSQIRGGGDDECILCDDFQTIRDVFWEVAPPSGGGFSDIASAIMGRIDILTKVDASLRAVDIYEVKKYPLNAGPQLSRYRSMLHQIADSQGEERLQVQFGSELALEDWQVLYRIDDDWYIAWAEPEEAGVIYYSKVDYDDDKVRSRVARAMENMEFAGTSNTFGVTGFGGGNETIPVPPFIPSPIVVPV